MGKFFAGLLIGILCMLSYNHFTYEEETAPSKDTITVQMEDQTIEVKDTANKDTVK